MSMKEPTYSQAVHASWQLAWRHKSLWAFGLFAMLLGQLGLVDLVFKVLFVSRTATSPSLGDYLWWLVHPSTWTGWGGSVNMAADGWIWLAWLVLTMLALGAMILFVAVVSQGALVYVAARHAKHPALAIDETKAWHQGVTHFWRLLGLNIVRKLMMGAVSLLLLAAVLPAVYSPSPLNKLFLVLLVILAILVGLVISFLLVYAACYVVVEEYRLPQALREAWRLFVRHPFVSLEVGGIVILANLLLAFLAVVAVVYILFLPILVTYFMAVWFGSAAFMQFGMVLGYALFILCMVVGSALFTVFTTSVWSYLFTKMHRHGLTSRLFHFIKS